LVIIVTPARIKHFFGPSGFILVDNNPASIVIPTEGTLGISNPYVPSSVARAIVEEAGTLRTNNAIVVSFDDSCRANPLVFTADAGSQIVLHNKASVRRTITVGPKVYIMKPESRLTISASDLGLQWIGCDTNPQAAQVIVS
jgi:hypothetical protein